MNNSTVANDISSLAFDFLSSKQSIQEDLTIFQLALMVWNNFRHIFYIILPSESTFAHIKDVPDYVQEVWFSYFAWLDSSGGVHKGLLWAPRPTLVDPQPAGDPGLARLRSMGTGWARVHERGPTVDSYGRIQTSIHGPRSPSQCFLWLGSWYFQATPVFSALFILESIWLITHGQNDKIRTSDALTSASAGILQQMFK